MRGWWSADVPAGPACCGPFATHQAIRIGWKRAGGSGSSGAPEGFGGLMLDIGAGDPDIAQHALVETGKVQAIPVPAVPNENVFIAAPKKELIACTKRARG